MKRHDKPQGHEIIFFHFFFTVVKMWFLVSKGDGWYARTRSRSTNKVTLVSTGRSGTARFLRTTSYDSLPMICPMPAGRDRPAFDENNIPKEI